ncbi:MAG: alpha/beta hydrolase [Caldisericia bacterium]|nr:alpha/beta hydrolase [Caldisericia bacterium]
MFVNIDNLNIYYEIHGDGMPILLFHGWGGNSFSLYPIGMNLEKEYKVIYFDFPGFGKSDIPKRPFDGEDYKNFILKFIDFLNLKNYIIIGHSFGGRIGIRIAKDRKDKLKALILIDSAGIRDPKTLKQKFTEKTFKFLKNLVIKNFKGERREKILKILRGTFGSKDYKSVDGVMRDTLVKIVNEDLTSIMKEISTPTLILWGENDKELPLRHAYIMNKNIKNSKLVIIKNAGHFPYLDNLIKVISEIKSFLGEVINEYSK